MFEPANERVSLNVSLFPPFLSVKCPTLLFMNSSVYSLSLSHSSSIG